MTRRKKNVYMFIDSLIPSLFMRTAILFDKQKTMRRKGNVRLMYLRGDLSSFRLPFDFFDDELLDDVFREPRSLFELELFDSDDLDDFEPLPPLLLLPDLLDDLDDDLVGEREFLLCL